MLNPWAFLSFFLVFVRGELRRRQKHVVLLLNKVDLVPTWVTRRWAQELMKEFPTLAFHASITNPFGKNSLLNLLRQFGNLLKDTGSTPGQHRVNTGSTPCQHRVNTERPSASCRNTRRNMLLPGSSVHLMASLFKGCLNLTSRSPTKCIDHS